MPTPLPVRSLSRQLVMPVVGLVLVAVLANLAFAAWLAVRRDVATARAATAQVAAALEASRVALSPQVLDALHKLTGSHFVVWDPDARAAGAATLADPPADPLLATAVDSGRITVAGRPYRVAAVRSQGVRPETVLVLTPAGGLIATVVVAVWPVVAVAAATLAVLVPLGLRTTRGLAERITAVEGHVARIAGGEFGRLLPESTTTDAAEVAGLVAGVNRMSTTLQSLRDTLVSGERQRLLGQLAAGFAHELRNAVTGARLAIDLHRRRCAGGAVSDDSLEVAGRQLDILEEEVRGLLALGRPPATVTADVDVGRLCAEVCDLTGPRCEHAGVRLESSVSEGLVVVGRHDALRAALVNLVLNAIDAAGRDGEVDLVAMSDATGVRLDVEDTGPGPPADLAPTLHEPFVTGKPEGIGLGLAVAQAVAAGHGGDLTWRRENGRTRFSLRLPARQPAPVEAAP